MAILSSRKATNRAKVAELRGETTIDVAVREITEHDNLEARFKIKDLEPGEGGIRFTF